ncbi:MAG TPA: hypothetical protein VG722_08370, partial [Tepidisphaeraceae bacterium]|nr:hypothetical protein [Tepidisphaeraceae bacterium]
SGNTGWARIISLGQSSIAPRSYTARCAWADEHSRTIYSVFIPRRVRPQAGDRVEIAASQKSSLAILVSDRIERKDETKE